MLLHWLYRGRWRNKTRRTCSRSLSPPLPVLLGTDTTAAPTWQLLTSPPHFPAAVASLPPPPQTHGRVSRLLPPRCFFLIGVNRACRSLVGQSRDEPRGEAGEDKLHSPLSLLWLLRGSCGRRTAGAFTASSEVRWTNAKVTSRQNNNNKSILFKKPHVC